MGSFSRGGSVTDVETVLFVLLVAAFVAIAFGCLQLVRRLIHEP